jgi:hypothetical protein
MSITSAPKLFISYCREDEDIVKRLTSRIAEHNIHYFFDTKDISAGDSFTEWINRSINSSSHFLVLLTTNSLHADWVKLELDSAMVREARHQLTVVPLLYGIGLDDLPPLLSSKQSIHIYDQDADLTDFTRFLETLGRPTCQHATLSGPDYTRALSGVVFLHLGRLNTLAGEIHPSWDDARSRYTALFSQYLRCNAQQRLVSVVYLYIDWALRNAPLDRWKAPGGTLEDIGIQLLITENKLSELIKESLDAAERDCQLPSDLAPTFHLITITDILDLLKSIADIDSRLVGYLAGKRGKYGYRFTYDAPKFIEAVIRIARGFTPHLAWNPIIRIDEDVTPNQYAIRTLLARYITVERSAPFFFFSGRYGCPHTGKIDFLNDFAVRTHWISDPDPERPTRYRSNTRLARTFLADLSELGATQFLGSTTYYSTEMARILANRASAAPRSSPQVVSGAGLIMSARAVELLPPFMNFKHNMTWVDDYLKRRLHEALGDLEKSAAECIDEARFEQDRHPYGIKREEVERARDYLPRLFRGCVFRRLISELDENATSYTQCIKDIVFRKNLNDAGVSASRDKMRELAMERCEEIMLAWQSPEFKPYEHYQWAASLAENEKDLDGICQDVVDNALGYLELVGDWPLITRTIKKLDLIGNRWLFLD